MKYTLLLLLTFLVALSSCGIHIQKRLYRDGFYISTHAKHAQNDSLHTTSSAEAALQPDPANTISKTDSSPIASELRTDSLTADSSSPHQQFVRPSFTENNPANEPALGTEQRVDDPWVQEEFTSIQELHTISMWMLIGWIVLPGLSFIASAVVAFILLARIRDLRSGYTLTESQSGELERIRKFQIAILIASLVIVVLLAALFLAFFYIFLSVW